MIWLIEKEFPGIIVDDDFNLIKFNHLSDRVHLGRYRDSQKSQMKGNNKGLGTIG